MLRKPQAPYPYDSRASDCSCYVGVNWALGWVVFSSILCTHSSLRGSPTFTLRKPSRHAHWKQYVDTMFKVRNTDMVSECSAKEIIELL